MSDDPNSDNPTVEPNAFPTGGVTLAILACFAVVAVGAGTAWFFFPQARLETNPQPTPVAGIPLEIQPVDAYRIWLDQQQASLAGAEGRTPIKAAMDDVARRGNLDAEAAR